MFGLAKAVQIEFLIELVNKQQASIEQLHQSLADFRMIMDSRIDSTIETLDKYMKELKEHGDFGQFYDYGINTIGMSDIEEEDKKAGRPTKIFKGGD